MKKKWILLAEGLLLAVLFVLSFGGSDIVFEADHQQLYRVEETGGIVSKDFALNPGVYRIIVESDIANGGIGSGMEISLEAEETTFRAIRGNRATLPADTEHKRITYYVADTVDAAHLQIQPFSEGGNVESREDNRRKKDSFCNSAGSFCLSGWNCDIPQKSIV